MGAIRFRRGTSTAWASADPVLGTGEPGFETDTGQVKIGNGTDVWTDLDYLSTGGGGGGVGAATESAAGIIEIADTGEVAAGTDDLRAVTPLKLKGITDGLQDQSTVLDSVAAQSVTSYGLDLLELANQAALMALVQVASTSAQGKVELADDTETVTGTDAGRAVTPHGARAALVAFLSDAVFLEALQDAMNLALVEGTNIDIVYDDTAGTFTISAAGGGGGATDLDGLSDVVVTTPTTGHVLRHNGTNWVNVAGTSFYQAQDGDLDTIAVQANQAYGLGLLTLANQAALTAAVAPATTSLPGTIEIATQAEVNAGSDNVRAVTPTTFATFMAAYAQAKSNIVSAIASLDGTQAANTMVYFTGTTSTSAAIATLTAFARTLLDDTSASDVLDTLGFSAFIKTLIDDSSASVARGTLGVAAAPSADTGTTAAGNTLTPVAGPPRVCVARSALTAGVTIANQTGTPAHGDVLLVDLKSVSAQTITWGTNYRDFAGLGLPSTTIAGKWLYAGLRWNATDSKYDLVALKNQS